MKFRGKHVLILGSSSVGEDGFGPLGQALLHRLQTKGAAVSFDAVSGRGLAGDAPNRLVGRPSQQEQLQELLNDMQPDVVLIVLGGNPAGDDDELYQGAVFVQDAVANVGAELYWVGPPVYTDPYAQTVTEQYDRLVPQVLGTRYHSSQPWTHPTLGRARDEIHFTPAGASAWADRIFGWLEGQTETSKGSWLVPVLAVTAIATMVVYLYRRRRPRSRRLALL